MPKVSIIIPFYNTEKYIGKCLETVVNQTLDDIEVICVNDCSTDNSLDVVYDFANKDKRIKVINNPLNLKQGASRNIGIKMATGEYIGFIDSDDWIDLDYFEKLYVAVKKHNSDIALATNVRIGNGKTKKRLIIEKEEFKTNLQEKFDICSLVKNPCPTNKIYKRTLLLENNVFYPENCYCEDKLFTVQAVYYANGVVSVPGVNYYYFRNPDSTVNSKSKKHLKQLREDKNEARLSVVKFLRENNADIRDKEFWAVSRENRIFSFPLITLKESLHTKKWCLFGTVPMAEFSL